MLLLSDATSNALQRRCTGEYRKDSQRNEAYLKNSRYAENTFGCSQNYNDFLQKTREKKCFEEFKKL